MGNVYPFVTSDGSIGLYDCEFEDIYHSALGAYTEACEKFVKHSDIDYYLKNYNQVRVLDICYGIGYNTKSTLQNFFSATKNKKNKKLYNDTIHSDNITASSGLKISIDSVDINKFLMSIAPILKKYKNYNLRKQSLPNEKIRHYLSKRITQHYKYNKFIDYLILISMNNSEAFRNEFYNIINGYVKEEFKKYFDKNMINFMRFLLAENHANTPTIDLLTFVHNIYYRHISSCYKTALKALKHNEIEFAFHNDDARTFILSSDKTYDLIFLDAFSTDKCPCLWTYDFISMLSEHLSENGKLITYSNAAHVRNAMLMNNLFVGKIYNDIEKKYTGTIASKNKSFIKHELTEDDLRLIKSKSGIVYRDEELNASNEQILKEREEDIRNSSFESSSHVLKDIRKKTVQNV